MDYLTSSIEKIGREMVNCSLKCEGVRCDSARGVLPRCLILESDGRSFGRGVAVVGINPGQANKKEIEFYREHGASYETVVNYWTCSVGFKHPYYVGIRKLLDQIGLAGPILWTELAKCESMRSYKGQPPLMTLRVCTGLYLRREINELSSDWPLIAVGTEAFKAISYLFPNRSVIGIPHPTGSFGHFAKLMPQGKLRRGLRPTIEQMLGNRSHQVLWLR